MVMRQFAIYVVIGVVSAVVDIGLMQLLIFLGMHYLEAATVGFVAGLISNYLLHSLITFKRAYSLAVLMRFMVGVVVNYVLTLMVIQAFYYFGVSPLIGKIVSLPLVAVNGFIMSKYWIYTETKKTNVPS